MKIEFADAATGIIAQIVDQDALPDTLEPVVTQGAQAARFAGKAGQVFETFVERSGQVVRLTLAGAGEKSASGRIANLERAGAGLVARFLTSGETTLSLDLTGAALTDEEVAAVLLGARLRAWRYDLYRTTQTDEQKPTLGTIRVVGAPAGAEGAWAAEAALAEGIEFTRELVTEPANVIYPESFVARCQERLAGTGIEITVLGEDEMRALGMGALLGVSQGSPRAAQLIAMKWNGGAAGEKPVAFVGKGVTFDSGGISIKGAAGMEDMKWDMGGAGAVAGTMLALARRGAKANVIGVCGLVENMPDGNAQRPGDVVTSMSGQTIEVINTDA
jgi:leucyl aminopeptidase